MNPSLWEEHGEIPRRGQSPVAGLAAELASYAHGILSRPAPDSSAVLPDVHADRHAVSIGQLQRLGCDSFALGQVALLVQELEIPAAMRSAVNPGDDVIDRGAARRGRQVIPAPRAAPVLQLHQLRHECQAVRCPRHNLVVMLPITSPGAKRPAAEPLTGRHLQPAHTAPARLSRHEAKLTGRSDIEAVAGGQRGGPCGGRLAGDLLLQAGTQERAWWMIAGRRHRLVLDPQLVVAGSEARLVGVIARPSRAGGSRHSTRWRRRREITAWAPGRRCGLVCHC